VSDRVASELGPWKAAGSVSYGQTEAQFDRLLESARARARRLNTVEIVHAHGESGHCRGRCKAVLPTGKVTPYPDGPSKTSDAGDPAA
jgi:hypothetical protein